MKAPRKRSAKRVKLTPSSCAINDLPNHILTEILLRLPIKTLTASKGVCKPWLNLIRDPHFCHLHRARAPLEVCIQPYNDVTKMLHLGNFNFPNNLPLCPLEFPNTYVDEKLIFANSCNGLLCYYSGSDVNRFALVWNPFTSELITFPPPKLDKGLSACRGYAFGFSSEANKFKLLRFMGQKDEPPYAVMAEICTIEEACSWKTVGPCNYWNKYDNDLRVVLLHGALHWVPEIRPCSGIVVFNLDDDGFGKLPFFSGTDGNDPSGHNTLGVLAGCLCIAVNHRGGGVTLWLMKEYGVKDSWTKLFCLGSTISTCKGLEIKYDAFLPITCMDNGEILVKCFHDLCSTVILYNPVQRIARVLGSGPLTLRVIAYRPSLVLLKDSMLGYDVHVKPKCAGLKQGQISTTDLWTPMKSELRPIKESTKQFLRQLMLALTAYYAI